MSFICAHVGCQKKKKKKREEKKIAHYVQTFATKLTFFFLAKHVILSLKLKLYTILDCEEMQFLRFLN